MNNEEHRLQCQIHEYLLLNKVFHFAVPNGGLRNVKTGAKLKKEGVMAGVGDLIILLPKRAIFIEIKLLKGYQSISQKKFQKQVEALGFEYLIWRSLDDAIEFLN